MRTLQMNTHIFHRNSDCFDIRGLVYIPFLSLFAQVSVETRSAEARTEFSKSSLVCIAAPAQATPTTATTAPAAATMATPAAEVSQRLRIRRTLSRARRVVLVLWKVEMRRETEQTPETYQMLEHKSRGHQSFCCSCAFIRFSPVRSFLHSIHLVDCCALIGDILKNLGTWAGLTVTLF